MKKALTEYKVLGSGYAQLWFFALFPLAEKY